MPAIHPPKLKQEVSELVQHYAEPEKFLRKLEDLFAFYGDQTKRVGQRMTKTRGLPSANVPQPVLRQIVLQLIPYAENVPHAIQVLARNLWNHAYLEHRQLAALLIGKLPINYSNEVLTLITKWCQQNQEESLLVSLATHSLEKIQREDPDLLLEHIETWLYPPQEDAEELDSPTSQKADQAAKQNLQKLGLSAMVPLVSSTTFMNLPKIYNLLKPFLRDAPTVLRPYLIDLLRPLARRSPQEVAYILRTELTHAKNKHLVWLARRTLDNLTPDHQEGLRTLIFPQQEND